MSDRDAELRRGRELRARLHRHEAEYRALEAEKEGNAYIANGLVLKARACFRRANALRLTMTGHER